MSGWNLKEGKLIESAVSDDEYWSLLNYVFSDACKKTNTYKFGLIKSICDQIFDLSMDVNGIGYFISYEKIFSKFAENYWNLVNKYHLKQMIFNGKSEFSKVEIILRSSFEKMDFPAEISFQSIPEYERKKITGTVTTECKSCVIGALYDDFDGKLYAFDLKAQGIIISPSAYNFISKYKFEIEKLNYYSWARFLEKINDDNALVRVLEKLDLSTPQRKDLSMYREILFREFQEKNCFYCGKKLKQEIHVDHFIPWCFVKSDNLWNFVLACPECNRKKSGFLVTKDYLVRINERNELYSGMHFEKEKEIFICDEYRNYKNGLLDRMWMYAKLSGLKEINNL